MTLYGITTVTVITFTCIVKFVEIETMNFHGSTDTLLLPHGTVKKSDCECGKLTRKLDTERIGKAKIPDGRIPWLAELVTSPNGYKESYNEYEDEFRPCFGSIVSLQTVLFPASCIDRNTKTKPKVKFHGIQNAKESIHEITSVLIHPGYRRKFDNDLALVKLKRAINYNASKVVPICLPEVKRKYPPLYPNTIYHLPNTSMIINESEKFDRVPPSGEDFLLNSQEETTEIGDESRTKPCRNPNPPCVKRPCPCPNAAPVKKPYVLEPLVTRTWFYRKGPGYDYLLRLGRFQIQMMNESTCQSLFPEVLKSKLECMKQMEIKEVLKHKNDFFLRMELGMPMMLTNTTLVKGKPVATSTKFYLTGMRAPGRYGIPLLESRKNVTALLKIDDYIPWIKQNSFEGHFCKT